MSGRLSPYLLLLITKPGHRERRIKSSEKGRKYANYFAKELRTYGPEKRTLLIIFQYHTYLQICQRRRELQLQILFAVVHRNAFVCHSLRLNFLVERLFLHGFIKQGGGLPVIKMFLSFWVIILFVFLFILGLQGLPFSLLYLLAPIPASFGKISGAALELQL